MPLRRIKKKISKIGFNRFFLLAFLVITFCVLIGYLIVVVSASSQDKLKEIQKTESIFETLSIDELR